MEIKPDFSSVLDDEIFDDYLAHYGVGHLDNGNSGRYRYGSGKNPMQRDQFVSQMRTMENKGYSEKAIAEYFGLTTTKYRIQKQLARDTMRQELVATARGLKDEGKSLREITEAMGYKNDSSVRALLDENAEERMMRAMKTADILKAQVEGKGAIDVGHGVEASLNVTNEKMKEALYILELEGYPTYSGRVPQATNPGQTTTVMALCPKGTTYPEYYTLIKNQGVSMIDQAIYSPDGGYTFLNGMKPPVSVDSKRVFIKYAEDGGTERDGLVELRRNVDDLNMGGKNYAQVRILVDGNKYIKGMAVYSDDIPDGYDILVNSNKSREVGMDKALKDIKNDPDNPFGALISRQNTYTDKNGKIVQGALNIRSEEGDWGDWADNLPSQFLSKQSMSLIKRQLKLTEDDMNLEYKEILEVTNPVIKQQMLTDFADKCDKAATSLKAAALPRQRYHVILPMDTLKDNECYCPNYTDGETLALIRYPHGGRFEIPIVTVNNKNKQGKNMIGTTPLDAIGINAAVAGRLSGADFDGDTVMAIPITDKTRILSKPPLQGLVNFDTKMAYGVTDKVDRNSILVDRVDSLKKEKKSKEDICKELKKEKKLKDLDITPDNLDAQYKEAKKDCIKLMHNTQNEMGRISNLITDMTLLGATDKELERAVKHSMVVIDAEKHHLNYKKSEADNNIEELKHKYQAHVDDDGVTRYGGAGTLISRAKSQESVVKRQGQPKINIEGTSWYDPTRPEGALIYKQADDAKYIDYKTGKEKIRKIKSTKMMETDDARTLLSDARTAQEIAYADYANKMKAMANAARKESYFTEGIEYSPANNKIYAAEVSHLKAALNAAKKNKPRERQAQLEANAAVEKAKEDDPKISKADLKKKAQKALTMARNKYGAKGADSKIYVSDNEWKAIQSGAVTTSFLKDIIANADKDRLRDLATPKKSLSLSPAKQNRIKNLAANGYTTSQIATYVGVSSNTVTRYLSEEGDK